MKQTRCKIFRYFEAGIYLFLVFGYYQAGAFGVIVVNGCVFLLWGARQIMKIQKKILREDPAIDFLITMIFRFFLIGPMIILGLMYYNSTGQGMLIFDRQQNQVLSKINFYQYLKNEKTTDKRYFYSPEEQELIGIAHNVAFKAKIHLNKNDVNSVNRFHQNEKSNTAWQELRLGIKRCVESAAIEHLGETESKSVIFRSISIKNMNEVCPLSDKYGYQWVSDVEITQCYQKPNTQLERNVCLQRVGDSNYK